MAVVKEKYLGGKEACKLLGIHQRTLYQWDEKGWIETIRTPGNKRLYNVEKFLEAREETKKENIIENLDDLDKENEKLNISYVRVSSIGQKDDLERQKKSIMEKYPNHKMIVDIGSGINLTKRGISKIIKLAIAGKINEVVVAHKDRLARFGYDLIENIIKEYSDGKIVIMNEKEELEPEEELVQDVLAIMNVFVARMNGIRKYKKKTEPKIKEVKKTK